MKRLAILLFFCLTMFSLLSAQEIVSGIVLDSKNEPMPGVRVEIVDRSEVTTTDIDGKFRIELPSPAKKIRLTYPGFKPVVKNIRPDMIIKMGHGWSAGASGYRGFWDIQGGFGFGGNVNVVSGSEFIKDIHTSLSFGWITTHGYQINHNLFVGAGIGVFADAVQSESNYYNSLESSLEFYALRFPIFAAARWDFGLDKKTAPYIDLKAGYQFNKLLDTEDIGYNYSGSTEITLNGKETGGFFLQPSVGMRASIGGKRAMNLGLAYCISVPKKIVAHSRFMSYTPSGEYVSEETDLDLGVSRGGVIMLNIGFDF